MKNSAIRVALICVAQLLIVFSGNAQSLQQVLPRADDAKSYWFDAIACSDWNNCTIPARYRDSLSKLYYFCFERTTDGGLTWKQRSAPFAPQRSEADRNWLGAIAVDSLTVLAYGDSGQIARTSDAGATWQDVSIVDPRLIGGMSFIDNLRGELVGGGGLHMRTSDGGASWSPINVLPIRFFTSIKKFDEQTSAAFAHGIGPIFYTNDGWQTVDSLPRLWDPLLESAERLRTIGRVHWLNKDTIVGIGSIWYKNDDRGRPFEPRPYIMQSLDGGASWRETFDRSSNMDDVWTGSFLQSGSGIVVGEENSILRTSDHGSTWREDTLRTEVPFIEISDVALLEPGVALIDLSIFNWGKIFRYSFETSSVESLSTKILRSTKIYPNPAEESFAISNAFALENLEIYDALGRVHYSLNRLSGVRDSVVDCSFLPPGVYTLMATHKGVKFHVGNLVRIQH